MRLLAIAVCALVLVQSVDSRAEGCKYDSQCKGSRVCESGRCVASEPSKGRGSSEDPDGDDDDDDEGGGLPSGTVVRPCGCWGNAYPGQVVSNPSCASKKEVALPCQAVCPTGGYMWGTQCR